MACCPPFHLRMRGRPSQLLPAPVVACSFIGGRVAIVSQLPDWAVQADCEGFAGCVEGFRVESPSESQRSISMSNSPISTHGESSISTSKRECRSTSAIMKSSQRSSSFARPPSRRRVSK